MNLRPSALSTEPDPHDLTYTLKPPGHLFRFIKRVSSNTHLCLPRTLDPLSAPTCYDFPDSLTAFKSLPRTQWHKQSLLLEYEHKDTLVWSVTHNGASLLQQKNIDLMPQVIVVKMGPKIRSEVSVLEDLYRGRECADLCIGSRVLRAQLTGRAESTWVCMAPVFGPTLESVGRTCATEGGLPNWFLAHVFLGVLDGVAFVHADGISHNRLLSSNIVLNLYPRYTHYRYRGYPDIQLIGFGQAGAPEQTGGDANSLLRIMEEAISKWSDSAPFLALAAKDGLMVTDDSILLVLQEARQLLQSTAPLTLEDVRLRLYGRLVDIRHTGPENIPRILIKLLHADLATDAEFEHALREPTVLKFDAKHEEFVKIIAKEPIVMGSGGHAGMKTWRIMVMSFTARKKGFLRVIGEGDMEEEDVDIDGDIEMDTDETLEAMDVDANHHTLIGAVQEET